MARYTHIIGWGKYVPSQVMTNHDLEKMVNTSDEWIRTRTGISERRIAGPKETTFSMALEASREALQVANFDPRDLDLIVVASATPDHIFPATACLLQDALGARHAAAFDLSAGCSGFVYALSVASQMMVAGTYKRALVVGAETLSRILDWTDRSTCVLFGDGAGAFVLAASETPGGLLSFVLGSDGSGGDLLIVPGGGSKLPASESTVQERLHFVKMNGREVFKFAARIMPKSAKQAIKAAGLESEDIELFIPHQANLRIIKSAAQAMDLPMERVFVNVDRYGNTSAASVPIAFCEAIEQNRLMPGDHVVLVGFGAGLTWGAAVVQWDRVLPTPKPKLKTLLRRWLGYRRASLSSFFRRLGRRIDTLWGIITGRRL
ncbi:MAG: ketoacyl-ACP synthase III [Chloroflexi bacterium]|nr:ketoacyl-ACP synthase III [Chloroflexota bacterium]